MGKDAAAHYLILDYSCQCFDYLSQKVIVMAFHSSIRCSQPRPEAFRLCLEFTGL